jgi:uncharacterized membrane protein
VTAASEPAPEKETGRLEAFSDGVFGIGMTLLVLDLKVPPLDPGTAPTASGLGAALLKQWPSYFAFVTSFFTVLIMWIHHHAVFRLVRRVDATLLIVNGLLLLVVTTVAVPTAVVAEYLRTPAAPVAATFYAGTFVLVSLAFYGLLMAGFRPSVLDPAAPPATIARLRRSYLVGPPLYLLATVVAPFSPWVAMGICTALWIFWAATTSLQG